jgi:hypothetical protein
MCRTLVRNAWFKLVNDGPDKLESVHVGGNPHGKTVGGHVRHCFDYLRQSLMCHADPTMEAFLEDDGVTPRTKGSSGWGVRHTCNDFGGLVDWIEEHDATGY